MGKGVAMAAVDLDGRSNGGVKGSVVGDSSPVARQATELDEALGKLVLSYTENLSGLQPGKMATVARTEVDGRTFCLLCLPAAGPCERLSRKQRDIVLLVAQGLTNKEIANRMGISPATISSHLARIFRKYGVDSRAGLASSFMAGTGRDSN
jgi:DNA-binding CsgD family transcriptional regulator